MNNTIKCTLGRKEMKMKYNAQDRKLNILDMIFEVVLKWRSIILTAVILAILAAGFSYYSSVKQGEILNSATTETVDLSESNELMILRYADLYELYLNEKDYSEKAPFMNLDPNNHYEGRIQYYIQVGEEVPEVTQNAIVAAYEQALCSETFYKKIDDVIEGEKSKGYYGEIIDYRKNLEKAVCGEHSYEQIEFVDGMLVVAVRDNDEELCKAIYDVVLTEINNAKKVIDQKVQSHTLIDLSSGVMVKANELLLMWQKSQRDKVINYNAALVALENQLTEAEVAYAKTLVPSVESEEEEQAEATQTVVTDYTPCVSKKLTVLGFLAGGFLGVLFYAFLYLINGCLRMNDDFFESQEIRVLGYLSEEKKSKKKLFGFVDKLILRMRYRMVPAEKYEETIALVVANIAIMCGKEQKQEITITRSGYCENEKKVLDKLAEGLEKRGIHATQGKSISCDQQALENASESEMLVLVETVNKTTCYAAQTEIEVSREHGMKVLGVVMLID